eukprot:Hpha_TRINITY_DN23975_c0_g1::TRINITY_DN23975_c0_g1_i1::g.137728::m.137728
MAAVDAASGGAGGGRGLGEALQKIQQLEQYTRRMAAARSVEQAVDSTQPLLLSACEHLVYHLRASYSKADAALQDIERDLTAAQATAEVLGAELHRVEVTGGLRCLREARSEQAAQAGRAVEVCQPRARPAAAVPAPSLRATGGRWLDAAVSATTSVKGTPLGLTRPLAPPAQSFTPPVSPATTPVSSP